MREAGYSGRKGPFHQAFDDACYTAEVMKCLDWEKAEPYISMDYYRLPQNRKEEVFLRFPGYTKYVSRVFDTREDAIADRRVTDMVVYDLPEDHEKEDPLVSVRAEGVSLSVRL